MPVVDTDWELREWRYDQARDLGLTAVQATLFAEGSDAQVADLRRLIEHGCAPDLAFRIVQGVS